MERQRCIININDCIGDASTLQYFMISSSEMSSPRDGQFEAASPTLLERE
jgi:hypothetical protein